MENEEGIKKAEGRHLRELTYENSSRHEIIIYHQELKYLELKPSEPQKAIMLSKKNIVQI